MSPTIPWTAGRWAATGGCSLCAAPVVPDGFRDRAAYRDFHITGLCQACQDELYFRPSVADARMRYPVRRGVLAAPAVRDGAVVELALLPFLCVVPEARVAWEARWMLRAGARLAPLDPWHELEPAEPVLRSHQVRLTEVADLAGAEVRAALDVDFAVVLDAPARGALAGLPLKDSALCVALAEDLRSRARLGPPLDGLLAYWLREPVSVVRACALLVLALAAPAGRGRTRPGALGPLLQHPERGSPSSTSHYRAKAGNTHVRPITPRPRSQAMTDRYQDAPRLALDCESARLMTLVVEAAGALSAPRAPCAIVCIEPPERSPAGPWLGLLAAGPDLFGMSEPDGHALLAEMAAGLVAACPGVRALAPVAGVTDITVTLATEAGRLVTFAPLLVTDRAALAWLETDVRPDAARPAPVE